MPISLIKQVQVLKNLPVFSDYKASADLPVLRRFNLIYGFNGCGKTTLSRVFASAGTGKGHDDWPSGFEYSIRFTNGSEIRQDTIDPTLIDRIHVFNVDFVSENLRWGSGEANPIFYISKDQSGLAQRIEAAEQRKVILDSRKRRIDGIFKSADTSFNQLKTDRARLIATELSLGRRYVATNLESDYGEYTHNDADTLDEAKTKTLRSIVKQDDPLAKMAHVSNAAEQVRKLVRVVGELLPASIGAVSSSALREHTAMLGWFKDGLDYHKAHEIRECLFCGSLLPEARLRELADVIDTRYDDLLAQVGSAIDLAKSLRDDLQEQLAGLPSKNDIQAELQESFAADLEKLRSQVKEGLREVDRVAVEIEAKRAAIGSPVKEPDVPSIREVAVLLRHYEWTVRSMNALIDRHNDLNDDFESTRGTAREALRKSILAGGHSEYTEHKLFRERASNLAGRIRSAADDLGVEIERLKGELKRHGPAAEFVNAMIARYLGHDELSISARDEGYVLCRHGVQAGGAPSEGEKTAIALSYFLVTLEAEGRSRNDEIVVIDDPISSLDTRAMNYACSLIRSLGNVGQLIVLTHNLHVMNDLKKTWKRKTEHRLRKAGKDPASATSALWFIDTIQPDGRSSRESSIEELPKYLSEYDSEYHFLFHMMLRFIGSKTDRANYFYVAPNILRKILEIFLAFKIPGSAGLLGKIDYVLGKAESLGIDEVRIRAVERLANVESHGDSIDDLVSASSMTVEEAKDSAEALLKLMEKMDPVHTSLMRRQCRLES